VPALRRRPETLLQGILLAAVGGYLDAFTFLRFGVFANAQTGNVILVGLDAGSAHWHGAALHLVPVLAFLFGVAAVETLSRPTVRRSVHRPVRVALAIEIGALAVIAALPDSTPDLVVTVTVSAVAAIQFSTFRVMVDTPYTSLLASGNLRSMAAAGHQWLIERDPAARRQAFRLGAVIGAFLVAAIVAAIVTKHIGNAAVAVPTGLLVITLVHLILETRQMERAASATPDRREGS
jgi:uncharacterized membrane protein YoaK (UPF0700 family)